MSSPTSIHNTSAFTSTLQDVKHTSGFNLTLVILTAIFFFLVLSWYNFTISLYNLVIGNTTGGTVTHGTLRKNCLYSFIFALLWTVIALLAYIFFGSSISSSESVRANPLLRGEARSIALGNVDMTGGLHGV